MGLGSGGDFCAADSTAPQCHSARARSCRSTSGHGCSSASPVPQCRVRAARRAAPRPGGGARGDERVPAEAGGGGGHAAGRRRVRRAARAQRAPAGARHAGRPGRHGHDGVVGDGRRGRKQHRHVRPRHGQARHGSRGHAHALQVPQLHLRVHPPLHAHRPRAWHQVLLRHGLRPHGADLLVHHSSQARPGRTPPTGPHRRPGPDIRLQQHTDPLRGHRWRRRALHGRPLLRRQAPPPRQQSLGHLGPLLRAQRRLPTMDLGHRQPRGRLCPGARRDGTVQALHPSVPDAAPVERLAGALLVLGEARLIVLSSYSAFGKYTPQYKWLEEELKRVNRNETPWLIVASHSPWYNSYNFHCMEGEPMRVQFEQWAVDARVDLVFAGHVHAYERSHRVSNIKYNITDRRCKPVRDRRALVYMTIGDGGNIEELADSMTEPQPSYSAFREASFGHAVLDIKNRTHAYYAWYRNADGAKVAADTVWFTNRYYMPNHDDSR